MENNIFCSFREAKSFRVKSEFCFVLKKIMYENTKHFVETALLLRVNRFFMLSIFALNDFHCTSFLVWHFLAIDIIIWRYHWKTRKSIQYINYFILYAFIYSFINTLLNLSSMFFEFYLNNILFLRLNNALLNFYNINVDSLVKFSILFFNVLPIFLYNPISVAVCLSELQDRNLNLEVI